MRLDKYISNSTDLSRSEVKRLIRSGTVTINSTTATNPSIKVKKDEIVSLDGSPILAFQHRYFMLNKPSGVVSVTKDHEHPTAISLIYEHRNEELQIAGRLDIDTTGLLLITDDGKWNHRVTSPKFKCNKLYRVTLANAIENDYEEKLATGVLLVGEKRRCKPAKMDKVDSHSVTLSISEGKYHQVKRMFSALGNHVVKLHRYQIGDIILDNKLGEGSYRSLTEAEIISII